METLTPQHDEAYIQARKFEALLNKMLEEYSINWENRHFWATFLQTAENGLMIIREANSRVISKVQDDSERLSSH